MQRRAINRLCDGLIIFNSIFVQLLVALDQLLLRHESGAVEGELADQFVHFWALRPRVVLVQSLRRRADLLLVLPQLPAVDFDFL